TPSPTPTPVPDEAADATPAGGVPVSNPLITSANFAYFSVGVEIDGPYANILNFVEGLQSGSRLMLVTTLDVSLKEDASGVFDANVGGYIYSLVDAATAPSTATETGATVAAQG
ncbi:MAG: hypothetical protein ABWX82_15170, partial [Leifsonia sp.]